MGFIRFLAVRSFVCVFFFPVFQYFERGDGENGSFQGGFFCAVCLSLSARGFFFLFGLTPEPFAQKETKLFFSSDLFSKLTHPKLTMPEMGSERE